MSLYWCMSLVFFDKELLTYIGYGIGVSGKLFSLSLLVTTVVTVVISVWYLGRARLDYFSCRQLVVSGVASSLSLFALMLVPAFRLPQTLSFVAVAIIGCGAAVLIMAWGGYISGLPYKISQIIIPSAFFISYIFQYIKDFSIIFTIIFSISIPILSSIAWCALNSKRGSKNLISCGAKGLTPYSSNREAVKQKFLQDARRLPWKMIFLLFCCSLMGGLIERVGTHINPEVLNRNGTAINLLVSGILLISIICLVMFGHSDTFRMWPAFLILFLGSLMVLPAMPGPNDETVTQLIISEKRCLIVLLWVFIAGTIVSNGLTPMPAFGIGHAFLQSLPNLIGQSIGDFLSAARLPLLHDISFLSILMAFVITIALVLMLIDKDLFVKMTHPNAALSKDVSENHSALDHLCMEYGLSQREKEVMGFLVRGYTFPRISDELGVSMNTIRTHSRNIYRKLGIHTKQELIDMVDQNRT